MTNIVQLRAPRNVYKMVCPECDGDRWDWFLTDMPDADGMAVAMLACNQCSFFLTPMMILGDEDEEG